MEMPNIPKPDPQNLINELHRFGFISWRDRDSHLLHLIAETALLRASNKAIEAALAYLNRPHKLPKYKYKPSKSLRFWFWPRRRK